MATSLILSTVLHPFSAVAVSVYQPGVEVLKAGPTDVKPAGPVQAKLWALEAVAASVAEGISQVRVSACSCSSGDKVSAITTAVSEAVQPLAAVTVSTYGPAISTLAWAPADV